MEQALIQQAIGAVKRAFGYGSTPKGLTSEADEKPLENAPDFVQYVNSCYREWYQWRLPYESGWYLDVAFYLGQQWSEWSDAYKLLREPRAPSWRVRYVANKIMPTIETTVGKMNQGQPQLSCSPQQSPSPRAYTDARMGDKILRGLWDPLHLSVVMQELDYWAYITGDGYLKTVWNPTAGKAIRFPGQPAVYPGEMSIIPMGPYGIFTPPYQQSLDLEPAKLIEARLYDVEVARMMFPDIAAQIVPDDDGDREVDTYEERLVNLVSPLARGEGRGRGTTTKKRVLVKEMWEDPQTLSAADREKFPDGRVISVVNSVFAGVKENPYGWIPYLHLKGKVLPGRFHGLSLVDQLIPIQRNKNRGRSDVIESRAMCSRPMVNAEQGHGIVRPLAEPGRWLERRKGWAAPAFMEPPRMSDYHIADLKDTDEDFQEVSQMREVSRGQLPSANVTGVAVNMLQQADNIPLTPLATRKAAVYAGLGHRIVSMAQAFYKEPRMISVVGEGHETEVVEFLGQAHNTPLTVRCSVESVMPESRAAKQARVMEATKAGVLDPVLHRAQILRASQFGNVDEIWESADGHRQKAKREHRVLLQGMVVQVDSFDDDEVHLLEHVTFQVTPEYEAKPPVVKQAFEIHTAFHRDRLAAMQAAAAGMGSPAPAPPASPSPQPAPSRYANSAGPQM